MRQAGDGTGTREITIMFMQSMRRGGVSLGKLYYSQGGSRGDFLGQREQHLHHG